MDGWVDGYGRIEQLAKGAGRGVMLTNDVEVYKRIAGCK